MPSIEELQLELERQISALAEQRQQEAERIEKEARERKELEEHERQERLEQHRKRQEELHRQKQEQEAKVAEQQRELARRQAEVEAAQNAARAAKEEQERMLEELKVRIANAEFAEEQHRKRIESLKTPAPKPVVSTEINVEYPEAPVNPKAPGEAVAGTGGLEEGPLMSTHLRQILRQHQRQ